jgi:D-glycero-alpha-D-manno-heptose-7-phosphate kinase
MRIVSSAAPLRICDNGGWTDTWFAAHGRVFSIAVRPRIEVTLRLSSGGSGRYDVALESYGERFSWRPGDRPEGRRALVAAVMNASTVAPDEDGELAIRCAIPGGASTGTSSAVAVALVGALARARRETLAPLDAAMRAHDIETRGLGRESGIQDQLAAAFGGINLIEIDRYPVARVVGLPVSGATRHALARRLLLVYLGRSHESYAIHDTVIRGLRDAGPAAAPLEALRRAALASADAVVSGDLEALGAAMQANTDAQVALHPDLVSADARQVIATAAAQGAVGWKVNGAGGPGGSVTILCGTGTDAHERCIRAVEAANRLFRHLPIELDTEGLRVWESP